MKTRAFFLLIILLMASTSFAQKDGDKGYADVNGIKLYYEVHGNGSINGAPPIVLIHGGLMNSALWGPTLPAFAQNHKVIAVDLQGHGRTADANRPMSIATMGDDIAGLLKYLHIDKADVAGYSLGGGVALQVALRHPQVVRKLVLLSTPFRRNGFYADILKQQEMVGSAMAEQMKQMPLYTSYASLNPHPEDWPHLLDKIGAYMKQDFDYSEQIRKIKIPTMIICGDADIFPPSHAVEMFNLLGGGLRDGGWDGSGRTQNQLAILPGLTHYVIGASPEFAKTAIPFLDAK